jgi:DNA polymerase III epsilon subunit-like protein
MIIALFVAFICYIIAQIIVSSKKESNVPLVKPTGNLLIFDTETNGFPNDWKASLYDTDNWPRIVSIAWNKIAPDGQLLSNNYAIIKPDGFSINAGSTSVHGISNANAEQNGLSLKDVLLLFEKELSDCKYLVAHNIEFDFAVVFAEYTRTNITTENFSSLTKICTMKKSTDFCRIPSSKGYKYPKLNELYQKLFSTTISNEHNAQIDADACMKCFKELYNKKVIKF